MEHGESRYSRRSARPSPSHRANILGNYNAIGIGVACNGDDLYATEDFAR